MIIFPPQEFITWTDTLTQFPWPIQVDDFPPYAEKLGWTPTPRPTWFNVKANNDTRNVILGDDRSGNVRDLFLSMARNEAEDDEGAAELNDHFVTCVAAGRKAWGGPFLPGGSPETCSPRWQEGSRLFCLISSRRRGGGSSFRRSKGGQVLRGTASGSCGKDCFVFWCGPMCKGVLYT